MTLASVPRARPRVCAAPNFVRCRTEFGDAQTLAGTPPKVGPCRTPTPPPRIRKAREEEGRGFGQGLISEKSLDEVILAYLSEDADEK